MPKELGDEEWDKFQKLSRPEAKAYRNRWAEQQLKLEKAKYTYQRKFSKIDVTKGHH